MAGGIRRRGWRRTRAVPRVEEEKEEETPGESRQNENRLGKSTDRDSRNRDEANKQVKFSLYIRILLGRKSGAGRRCSSCPRSTLPILSHGLIPPEKKIESGLGK